jgi:hypothetical protein
MIDCFLLRTKDANYFGKHVNPDKLLHNFCDQRLSFELKMKKKALKVQGKMTFYFTKDSLSVIFLLTTYDLSIDCFTFSFFQMAVFDHLLCMEERLNFVFFCLSQK